MPPKLVTNGRLLFTVLPQEWHPVRPRDCADGDEPCPWDGCAYRIDNPAHPEVTCAIDVTDEGPVTLRAVAEMLGVSNPMVQKIQNRAMRKILEHPERETLLSAIRGRG